MINQLGITFVDAITRNAIVFPYRQIISVERDHHSLFIKTDKGQQIVIESTQVLLCFPSAHECIFNVVVVAS